MTGLSQYKGWDDRMSLAYNNDISTHLSSIFLLLGLYSLLPVSTEFTYRFRWILQSKSNTFYYYLSIKAILQRTKADGRGVMDTAVKMGTATKAQIRDETVCISYCTSTLEKGRNPIILLLDVGE